LHPIATQSVSNRDFCLKFVRGMNQSPFSAIKIIALHYPKVLWLDR